MYLHVMNKHKYGINQFSTFKCSFKKAVKGKQWFSFDPFIKHIFKSITVCTKQTEHTFFALLENWGRGCSHLHSQTVGPFKGVAVPHNKAAWLLVLQDGNSWVKRKLQTVRQKKLLINWWAKVKVEYPPWSLEISGLYQNFDVSCTNLTVTCLPASTSEKYSNYYVNILAHHPRVLPPQKS